MAFDDCDDDLDVLDDDDLFDNHDLDHLDFDDDEEYLDWPEEAPSMEDMGLCPHGVPDDGECDQCGGGSEGWDEEYE